MAPRSEYEQQAGGPVGLLIPLKRFAVAKERLSQNVSAEERRQLAQDMAATVVSAANGLPVWVTCDDPGVSAWAIRHGAGVIWRGGGLNPAVQASLDFLFAEGFQRVVVSHGDLPNASSFASVLEATEHDPAAVALVTDRHADGTNVLSLPADSGFKVQYGTGSCRLHSLEVERLGLRAVMVDDPSLALDVDYIEDLEIMRKGSP